MIREQVLGIVAMEPMGEYSANVKYGKLNIVTYNGSTYSALKDTLGNEPTNDEYWQLIAKKGDKGDTYELTDEDKENIKNDITENANSDFNKNVESKTNTFNDNVTEKTSSFNTNVENKTKEFNDNSTTKLEEFNTNSTNKLEEYNTNANAKLNEYNANADGVMTIAVDTRNELERVKNDILETGEANGNYLTLNDSTLAELQELEVSSNEKQVTTTGYNKLGLKNLTMTSNGVTLTIEDGVITLNGTNNGTESIFELSGEKIISSNTHKIKSFVFGGSATNTNGYLFYMYSEGWKDLVNVGLNSSQIKECKDVTYSIFVLGVKAGTFNNHKVGLLVGDNITEETPYEPYTGLKPSPSPDYPQEIPMITTDSVLKSIGKNLYNYKDMELLHNKITQDEEGWMTANFDNTNGTSTVYLNCYPKNLKLLPNTQYNIFIEVKNVEGAGQLFPCSAHNATQNNEGQFITSSYFKFSELSNGIIKNLIGTTRNSLEGVTKGLRTFLQFGAGEKGSITFRLSVLVDTTIKPDTFTYEPYQETILNMPIPKGEFVGYINDNAKDTLRVGYNEEDGAYHLYLDKMLGKVVLDENRELTYHSVKNEVYQFRCPVSDMKSEANQEKVIVKASHFKGVKWHNSWLEDNVIANWANNSALMFYSSKFVTVEEFKTWLSTNNVTAIYALANPYTLDLGMVDMPLSYDGVTNIFVDTDLLMNINAKYYRNFTETIRNLQINNDSLKNELASIESRLSALETRQASVVSESEVVE